MSKTDHVLAILGSVAVVFALVVAAAQAGPREPRRGVPGRGLDVAGGQGDVIAGGLPAGVSIDPETLELVGLDLKGEDGSVVLSWSTLKTYEYQDGLVGLPDALKALEGKKVTMAGFLLPLYEFDDIREFNLVASHWSCCFGVPPGINGWVQVTLSKQNRALENSTEPLQVTGTFRVREVKESGYVVAIYAIENAKAAVLGW